MNFGKGVGLRHWTNVGNTCFYLFALFIVGILLSKLSRIMLEGEMRPTGLVCVARTSPAVMT